MCDFINAHEVLIPITTFGDYKVVMLKAMKVIGEANLDEMKRRRRTRKEKCDNATAIIQRTKSLIAMIKQWGIEMEEIERRVEVIFGK